MPRLDWLTIALWVAAAIGNATLLSAMAWTGAFKRWPSLFALLALVNAQSGFCAAMQVFDHPACYFYGYYAFALLEDAAEVWLITQMALALAGVTPKLCNRIRMAVPLSCAVALCGTAVMTLTGSRTSPSSIGDIASHLDLAIALAWGGAFLVLPLVAKFFQIQWSGGVRPIALGFLVESMVTLLASYAAGAHQVAFVYAKAALYLVSLACWSATVIPAFRRVPHHARILAGMTTTGPESVFPL